MTWFLMNPQRLIHEYTQLEVLASQADWIAATHWRLNESLLQIDLDLTVHDGTYEATLTYPDVFPNTPAYIRPRDSSQRWSGHQYGAGGSLCLEWRPDNWHPGVTGADLVRSAYKLLGTEQDPVIPRAVQSAHQTTPGQDLIAEVNRLVATPLLLEFLAAHPPEVAVPIKTESILHHSACIGIVTQVGAASGEMTRIVDVPKSVGSGLSLWSWTRDGVAVRSEAFEDIGSLASINELRERLTELGLSEQLLLLGANEPAALEKKILLLWGTKRLRAFAANDDQLTEYRVIYPSGNENRIPASYTGLADIRVAIVGLGSMGSKIAVSLARSGVRKFLLIDDDVFLPENVCRNELSWRAVGVHKAEAVREELDLIAPEIEVRVEVRRLVGQESSRNTAAALKSLADCELIIDATANPEVFLQLAAIARANGCAMCWGEVFAGGIGGLIAASSPHRDPHPLAVRSGILAYLETLPPAPYMNATGYDVQDQTPIIADDADVTHIASALTRLAIGTALDQPSAFDCQAYLIGLRPKWIFSGPFHTQPIRVTGEGWETASATPADQEAAAEILARIIREKVDDQTNPATSDLPNS